MPWPPPMHSVTRPRFRQSRRIEWDKAGRQHTPGPDRMAVRGDAAVDVDDVLRQAELARHDDGDRANASLI